MFIDKIVQTQPDIYNTTTKYKQTTNNHSLE